MKNLAAVGCGSLHTAVVDKDGRVFAFGSNGNGRLGQPEEVESLSVPTPVPGLDGVVVNALACGESHTLVCTTEGQVLSWGTGRWGRLGLGHSEDIRSPSPGRLGEDIIFLIFTIVTATVFSIPSFLSSSSSSFLRSLPLVGCRG